MNWKRSLSNNAPVILSVLSSVGVITTAVTAINATPKAVRIINDERLDRANETMRLPIEPFTKKEIIQVTWKCYIPTALIGASTIACIFGANALNKQQQASLASAYALLAQSYSKYKNKVKELYGKDLDKTVTDDIQKDDAESMINPGAKLLFYDELSDRFFEAAEIDVFRAEYDTNRQYALDHEVNLNTFYEFLDLPITDAGTDVGWSVDASDAFYGYSWIEFAHELCHKEDGTEYYKIVMNYPPTADYIVMPF